MSINPAIVRGDATAKERAVLNAALNADQEPFPPNVGDILANPGEFLTHPGHIWLASRIYSARRNGVPILPQAFLAGDREGLVGGLIAEPPLPLSLAELVAVDVLVIAQARFVAREVEGLAAKILEHPERAPEICDLTSKALASAFDRIRSREGLSVRSPDEILSLPTDPAENLLGARLLTRGGRLVIAGAGGVGKSRLSLQLAGSVIAGRDFLGLPTYGRGTKWLVIQAENDNVRLKSDLGALRDWLGEDWAFVGQRLRIHTLETERDVFLSLDDEQSVAAIKRLIERERPDVVVWDSLYSFSSGDLNKDADMRETLTRLHQVSQHGNPKRGIVVLHHATTGKSGVAKLTGFDRASFGRNSKVLHSWTRGQINVGPLSADDNDTLGIACGKASNGREFPPFAIRLNTDAMIYELAPDVNVAEAIDKAQTAKVSEISPQSVADLAQGKTKLELSALLQQQTGRSRATAYRAIEAAEDAKLIRLHKASGTFQDVRINQ